MNNDSLKNDVALALPTGNKRLLLAANQLYHNANYSTNARPCRTGT